MKTLKNKQEPQKNYLVVKEPQNPKQALLSSIFPKGHPPRTQGLCFCTLTNNEKDS
jgi:hypothetical protein